MRGPVGRTTGLRISPVPVSPHKPNPERAERGAALELAVARRKRARQCAPPPRRGASTARSHEAIKPRDRLPGIAWSVRPPERTQRCNRVRRRRSTAARTIWRRARHAAGAHAMLAIPPTTIFLSITHTNSRRPRPAGSSCCCRCRCNSSRAHQDMRREPLMPCLALLPLDVLS